MKLFTKTLMAVGLLATYNAWADPCTMNIPGDVGVPRMMRTIVGRTRHSNRSKS